ncbi:MAG: 30S ribosomal protein S6 [Patescibacteria group bacterium]
MKVYELTYIISSELTNEEAKLTKEEIDSFIQKEEGVILRSENPVAKTLSYPIKKQGSGFFVVLEFQIAPEKLSELKEKLENNSKILRHFIVIKKPAKIRKERRVKKRIPAEPEKSDVFSVEQNPAIAPAYAKPAPDKPARTGGEKIELEDIEKKLEEILGE